MIATFPTAETPSEMLFPAVGNNESAYVRPKGRRALIQMWVKQISITKKHREVIKISAKKQKAPQFSTHISEFCQIIADAQSDYEWNKDEVIRLDKLTQDYLHKLELEGLNYQERAKVATKLSRCRRLRRESKDTVEVLEPLIIFLTSDKGKNLMNLLKETLGKVRKVEDRLETRSYRYRVLQQGELVPKED